MSRAYDSDGDDAAAALDEFRSARIAAEARTLSGGEVLRLRAAVEAAARALRQINTKGLPFAHRRDIEAARSALEDARRIVAKHHEGQRSTAGSTAAG